MLYLKTNMFKNVIQIICLYTQISQQYSDGTHRKITRSASDARLSHCYQT